MNTQTVGVNQPSLWLQDVESRGNLSFNSGALKNHKDAENYARKTYSSVLEREWFVAGWNAAFWAA